MSEALVPLEAPPEQDADVVDEQTTVEDQLRFAVGIDDQAPVVEGTLSLTGSIPVERDLDQNERLSVTVFDQEGNVVAERSWVRVVNVGHKAVKTGIERYHKAEL